MTSLLKGNFTPKKEVVHDAEQSEKESVEEQFKKAALNSIGGSMVYVERTDLTWDGEDE